MSEVLFRGKKTNDGKWVDGNLFVDEKRDKHEILVGYTNYRIAWDIDPETVGWCIDGLTDKNNRKIFTGDIVQDNYGNREVVKYCEAYLSPFIVFPEYKSWIAKECEVIGNIYDNPELLEGK